MALTLHRTLQPLSRLRHKVSAAFWLQSGACAVVAWSMLHGGMAVAPAARTAADSAGPTAAAPARAPRPASSIQLAAVPRPVAAPLALSGIDAIVPRNDT